MLGTQRKLSGNYRATLTGYFDNADACVTALEDLTGVRAIYVTLNPVDPALLARCANRLEKAESGSATKDHEIVRLRLVLLDFDPERRRRISSMDAEKKKAKKKSREIDDYLKTRGWPDPMIGDSGNGFHLLYLIDLPVEDEGLLKKVLAVLAERFDGDGVRLDRSVHNPARITKLYGTLSCKGDDTKERPHRTSELLKVFDTQQPVTREQVQELVDELGPQKPEPPKTRNNKSTAWDNKPDKAQIREMLAVIPKRPIINRGIPLLLLSGMRCRSLMPSRCCRSGVRR